MTNAPPLMRDLIRIPERVQTNDFVLKLSDGVTPAQADATVRDYVVTPQLARAFDHALGFIGGAVEGRKSAACYLHGSFGSGKSHFMAVLNLLLAGNLLARSKPELATAVTKHDRWINGRRFLMVPFHMIGAKGVENAIFSGYAEWVRRMHPDAPVPGFYLGERLFTDARTLRGRMGDDRFFADLNGGRTAADGWGDIGDVWDPASFDAATLERPEAEDRVRLVGDLIGTFFASYADVAAARGEAFVDLDTGLAIMSAHAQRLGYDAVLLFLDELILWLATHAGDVDFVATEGSKLSKLVEAQRSDRPVPIISFVARQRDLRELVGEHQAGALQLQFADTLKYWEARFDTVTLEDRNLPVIAQRRLLQPVSETARQVIDAEFDRFATARRDVVDTLLGTEGERDLFRMTYPFSPALMEALIATSSMLQRERTALKLMLTLLVNRRDELRLGSLIPVGDLWDEIATGEQPFSKGMAIQFDQARKLWTQKLLPMLEVEHGVAWQDLHEGRADPGAAMRFGNDARLLKTLLLAALVPEVPALRDLTARRLAALNHGSVASPIRGREGSQVLQKLRGWASRVGEIRIAGDTGATDPTVSLQITGVDVEPILANAAVYDNDGTRRTRLKRILFEMLGLPYDEGLLGGQPFVQHDHPWRGTKRPIDLYFEVVRELSPDRLHGRDGAPVLVLGMPFDPKNRPPVDHLAHAKAFADDSAAGGVVWQPSYLSDRAMRDLGTLVRIDELLKGDRLADASRMLSASDREQARAVLQSQQSALHQRLRACLDMAYGIRPEGDGCIGTSVPAEDRLVSLDTFRPQIPVGATMRDAVASLLDRLFDDRYPAHPLFEQPVTAPVLRRVLEQVQAAAGVLDQRLFVEDRAVRGQLAGFASPLKLGTMNQTHFLLGSHWADHFARMQAQAGGMPMTVAQLRAWMDQPKPMGLTAEVQNLVVLAFAAQADRSLFRNGAPTGGTLERVDDASELREQPLPDEAAWALARERAGSLFGLAPGEVRKGATVARLAADLRTKAEAVRPTLARLSVELSAQMAAFGVNGAAPRLVTLRSAQALVSDLAGAENGLAAVCGLAAAGLATSEAAVGRCLATAEDLRTALTTASWDIIGSGAGLTDARQPAAEALRLRLAEALAADEHVLPLRPALKEAQTRASRLLTESVQATPLTDPPSFPGPRLPNPLPLSIEEEIVGEGDRPGLDAADAAVLLDELRTQLAASPGSRLAIRWRLTRQAGGARA